MVVKPWVTLALSFLALAVVTGGGAPLEDKPHRSGQAANTPEQFLQRAQSLAAGNRWAEAEPLARRYLEAKPESADGHALLALVLFKQQKPRESMAEYVETAKLRDLTASELKNFALSCALLRMFADAEKWLTRSLEMNPDDAKGWEARGHLKFEQQHYADGIRDFEQSLRLAPKTVSAQTGIGLSYELLSHLDEAVAAYKTAISWQPAGPGEDPAPLHGLGRVLLKQNKPAEALSYLRRAVVAGPDNAQAHEELAKAYSSLGQIEPAQREMERAIELAPKVARLHFALGQLYRKAGMIEKAKVELDKYEALVGTHSTPTADVR